MPRTAETEAAAKPHPLADVHPQDLAEMFSFLDDLRESGATNMFGARPFLIEEYPEHRRIAASVLSAWMGTFSRSKSAEERAAVAKQEA